MKLTTINQDIVNAIYNIPLGSSNWKNVVEILKIEFKAHIGFMMIIRPNQTPITVSTIQKKNKLWESYTEDCYKLYLWNDLTKDQLTSHRFNENYIHMDNDYWIPNDNYHIGGGLLSTRNSASIVLGFPREKKEGAYEDLEVQQMTFYGRQIVRAIELDGVLGKSLPQKIYEDSLEASYGLSVAESKLVLELFRCGSLPKTSKSLNRSYHTVRNQMKSIFKKTETSNQIELFKLLSTNYFK